MSNPAGGRFRRWLREPLLHFALIGALLFVVYGRMNPAGDAGQRIVVTQAVVDDLARQHQARWMRPASEQELADLVEAHVRAEIQYREGLALGLDRDDPVIKRRVQQKLDVMAEEQLSGAAPTDAELAAYLAQNAARFTRPGTVSFEQLFFDGTASTAEVERAVASARAALASGADPAKLGQGRFKLLHLSFRSPAGLHQAVQASGLHRRWARHGGKHARPSARVPISRSPICKP